MTLRARVVGVLVAALAVTMLGWAPAEAGARPKVTAVAPSSGPLAPGRVTIKGSGFTAVKAVWFGDRKGRKIRVVSSRRLTVIPPRRSAPGTVRVRVVTRTGSSITGGRSRFSYWGVPTVSGVTPARGSVGGGDTVTVRGSGFAPGVQVRFGDAVAVAVRRISATRLTVVTPASLPGDQHVRVSTVGGKSRATTADGFTFVEPPAHESVDFTPAQGTYVGDPSGVLAVTGGDRVLASGNTRHDPWLMTLGGGTTPPATDQPFFLAPGGTVAPMGLAGVVSEVASRSAGGWFVTVAQAPLDDVLDESHLSFDGPATVPANAIDHRYGRVTYDRAGRATVAFNKLPAGVMDCTGAKHGTDLVRIEGDLEVILLLTDFRAHFRYDSDVFGTPQRLESWVTFRSEFGVKVGFHEGVTCKLNRDWASALGVKVPVGTTGALISVGPAVEMSVDLAASARVTFSHAWQAGFAWTADDGGRPVFDVRYDGADVTGAATTTVTMSAGPSLRFSWLDRVGAEAVPRIGATAELSLGNQEICATLGLFLTVRLELFYDFWVVDGTAVLLDKSWPLGDSFDRCMNVWDAPPAPIFATTSLPDAVVGQPYLATLRLARPMPGLWSVGLDTPLPPGLSLDRESGVISGIPTGPPSGPVDLTVEYTPEVGDYGLTTVPLEVVDESTYAGQPQPGGPGTGGDTGPGDASIAWLPTEQVTQNGPADTHEVLSLSGSGRWLLMRASYDVREPIDTPGHYGALELWDRSTGRSMVVRRYEEDAFPDGQLSADGRYAAICDADGTHVWDRRTGGWLTIDRGDCESVDISADGRFVAWSTTMSYWGPSSDLKVWDRTTGLATLLDRVTTLQWRTSAAISGDGSTVAWAHSDWNGDGGGTNGVVRVLDRGSGDEVARLTDHPAECDGVDLSGDGGAMSFSCLDNVWWWDRSSGQLDEAPRFGDFFASFSPSLSGDGATVVFDNFQGQPQTLLPGRRSEPKARSDDAGLGDHPGLLPWYHDGYLMLWHPRTGELEAVAGPDVWYQRTAISADGRFLAFTAFTGGEQADVLIARR
ncbi:MAG: IPT/TIG domain-containing protein [Nocardioidaceae bacterium]|nr:IPT/TIG domain-containing protein [Nocardioidaceae bacterium]